MSMRSSGSADVHADLNVTPLIDVLLVLLIIFMMAMPLATRTVAMEMPRPTPEPVAPTETLRVGLNADGTVTWNDETVERRQLDYLLQSAARQDPQPALLIAAADGARYEEVARVMALSRSAGLAKMSFADQ